MSALFEVRLIQQGKVVDTRCVNGRPLTIGQAPGNDMVLPQTSRHHALLWTEDGQLWIKDLGGNISSDGRRLEGPTALAIDDRIRLSDELELEVRSPPTEPTTFYPYKLHVSLQGPLGPEATLTDLSTGRSITIRSSNRVIVLYLLARRMHLDKSSDRDPLVCGWCSDAEIASGVWGRSWRKQIRSHLHVLVHRIRKDIKEAGLDPWCIEKKHRHTRVLVQEVTVAGSATELANAV